MDESRSNGAKAKTARFLVAVLSGTLALGINAKAAQDKEKSELEMTLSSTTMMLCLGSPLPLDLEIINRSSQQIKIDKVDLWARFVYSFHGTNRGRGGGQGSSCNNCRGDYVVVKPGATEHSSFAFALDSEFFKDTGKYKIGLTYGGITTNQLDFELYDCNPE